MVWDLYPIPVKAAAFLVELQILVLSFQELLVFAYLY